MSEIRTKKIGSNFVKEISYILMNEVKDPILKFVTITDCKVTNDLSFAKVYFTTLNEDRESVLDSLNKAADFIEIELSKAIEIRKMPQISFHYDDSLEYGENIEKIIEKIHENNNE